MPSAVTRYSDPRAHVLRERHLGTFGGDGIPVPIESIAEDLLGLRLEEDDLGECSGILIPAERLIIVNSSEAMSGDTPIRRHRFTIAHELGHWICHAQQNVGKRQPIYCRSRDLSQDADRDLEREVNVFAAELLMPEYAVRQAWRENGDVADCASRFGVSPTAMHWRLFTYGLLAHRPSAQDDGNQ
jgi:hypothetical protein